MKNLIPFQASFFRMESTKSSSILKQERSAQVSHFFPIPRTSTTFWRVLMAFSRTGSTDCMIPSLLSISLIYGCIPSMAFIFLATSTSGCPSSSLLRILAVSAFWMFLMAAVLATAASASPLASDERAQGEGGLKVDEEIIFVHWFVSVGSYGGDKGGGEFHLCLKIKNSFYYYKIK